MKKLIFIPLLLFCVTAFGQFTKPQLYTNINTNIRLKTASQLRTAAVLDSIVKSMATGSSMVYPGAGIALSTGSAWGTSITDNSANWNTAFGWGNHASAGYITLTGTQNLTGAKVIGGAYDLEFGTTGNELSSLKGRASTIDFTGTQAGQTISLYLAASGYLRNGNHALEFNNSQIRLTNTVNSKLEFDATGAILNLGATNATGDTYYRNSSGYLTRLPVGTDTHVLTLSGGLPTWAAPSTGFSDPMTTRGDLIYRNASNVTARLGIGGSGTFLSSNGTDVSWATPTATVALSGITAATGSNTINNADHAQEWQWNTLGAGTGLLLSSSSTAAASNTNTLFRVNQTGANATSTQTTYSGYFSNTKTGTSNTNVGLYATASGGSTNEAIRTNGGIIVTGSGLTTGTSFRIDNSSNAERYKIQDNGTITHSLANSVLASLTTGQHTLTTSAWYDHAITMVNSGSTSLTGFEFRQNNMISFLSGTGRYIMTRATFGNATAGTINGNFIALLVGTKATNDITSSFNPNAGTGTWTGVHIDPIYNTTGSYSGTVYGINYDPIVTSSTGLTHLSFRASAGNMLVPASSYHNYGTTSGTTGYGFRDNAGTMEFKNSGGEWADFNFSVNNLSTTPLNETVVSGEKIILADATTGNITINLPTAVGNKAKIHIKKTDSTSNTVVVDGSGAETVDGISAQTLYFQYQSITLVSNGTSWFII